MPLAAQAPAAADLKARIGQLASLDYPARMNAARLLRRDPAAAVVPALVEAVRMHSDQFVRYRALVLLTSFGDRGTPDLMRGLLGDPNERVREVAYRWLELHPERQMIPTLVSALQTETAEFVRPALVGALAALGDDPQVQRALLPEVTRGLDFFRSAVIDALGRHRAAYAVEAIAGVTGVEGPLQDDAILALGRIGGPAATAALGGIKGSPEIMLTVRAAQCLSGAGCDAQVKLLTDTASAAGTAATVRAAVSALAAIGAGGNNGALSALASMGRTPGALREQASVALASAAVRQPERILTWLNVVTEAVRTTATDMLKDGFDRLDEDFAEEQFFAAARASYWAAPDNSPARTLAATLIQRLEF